MSMAEVMKGLEAARSPDRLYPILTDRYCDFYAGRTADDRQLLAGEWCPNLLVGLFDANGNLRDVHYRRIDEKGEVERRLREWYGYTPGLIWVKRFRIAPGPDQPINPLQLALIGESGLAIAPFPLTWEGCYGNPADFPADDPDYVEMVRGWIERGNFALFWGNEIHLNGSGEVVGT
jgi:hypothetical protein